MNEESLFHQALQQPDATARAAFLDDACANQPELRARLEKLLRAHDAPAGLFEKAAVEIDTTDDATNLSVESDIDEDFSSHPTPAEEPGTRIGPYKLLQQIGEGGMGVVWMAEQEQPVRRKVALKIIKPGMDSRQVIARFEVERQALALMDHPNIARVLDAGTTASGRPFFVMELIHGVPITKYCDDNQLTPRQRLELFVSVCQAIQHAHQKGIIHRDVKPSNVLVTIYDGKPVPKVIDFGVAKAVEQRLTEQSLFTQHGAIIGTLEYMSPEQAEASALGVDTRSDIYSLGVLLYELLTGSTPLDRRRMRQASYVDILRWIREEEPPKPSTRLNQSDTLPTVAAARKTEPIKLAKLVRGELDWIVMKALEKDRNRRYEAAVGFARDIQRYLTDEPVEACPPSAAYKLRKFAYKNRKLLATASVIVFLLLTLLTLGVANALWWAQKRTAAETEAADAMKEAEHWQQTERWSEALSALRRAEGVLHGFGSDAGLRQKIDQRRKALEMLMRMEEARLQFAIFGQNTEFNDAGVDRLYAAAFKWYDLELSALEPREAAKRIRASTISEHLIAALDDWAYHREYVKENGGAPLRAVADLADDDPWRRRLREAAASADRRVFEALAAEAKALSQPPVNLVLLATTLGQLGSDSAAEKLLRRAQLRHPADFWINYMLGLTLNRKKPPDPAAVGFMRAALAIRPQNFAAHSNVGSLLDRQGNSAEAEVVIREAIRLHPDQAVAYFNLGLMLRNQRQPAGQNQVVGAVAGQLGAGLADRRKDTEIVEAFQQAIALRPDYAVAYYELGVNLCEQRKFDEGIAALKKALELNRRNLMSQRHERSGTTLSPDRLELDRRNFMFQRNLIKALKMRGESAATVVEAFRELMGWLPDDAAIYYDVGVSLQREGKWEAAMAHYQRAIAIKPNFAEALCNLGLVLSGQGRFAEGVTLLRRGHELGSGRPNWSYPSGKWVHDAERLVALDAKLPKVLAGELQPTDTAERIALAELCGEHKKCYAVAARFYAEAFAADPKLGGDLKAQQRYNAACYAALAGCGQGKDADKLDAKERIHLRQQARDWLLADLKAYRQLLEKSADKAGPTVAQRLQHWLDDPDFAGIRGEKALDQLPKEERSAWRKLWTDVAELLAQTRATAPSEKKPDAKSPPGIIGARSE